MHPRSAVSDEPKLSSAAMLAPACGGLDEARVGMQQPSRFRPRCSQWRPTRLCRSSFAWKA